MDLKVLHQVFFNLNKESSGQQQRMLPNLNFLNILKHIIYSLYYLAVFSAVATFPSSLSLQPNTAEKRCLASDTGGNQKNNCG